MASRPNKPRSYHSKKYNFKDNLYTLQPAVRGFLCMCSYGEKDCQKEAINLLREYSEEEKMVSFFDVIFLCKYLMPPIGMFKHYFRDNLFQQTR